MSKKIIIDFYRIHMPYESVSFEQLIDKGIQLSPQHRTKEVRYNHIHLHQASCNQDFWQGEVIRIRMVDPPIKASLYGDVEDIPLEDDEGLGERTTFLYHCPTKVLLLQNTQSGVSISTLLKYLCIVSNCDQAVSADPILNLNAMEKIKKMEVVHKFEVRVAGLDNPSILKGQDPGVTEIANLAEGFRAPSVFIKLSMAHKKDGSLDVSKIKESALNLLYRAEQRKNNQQSNQPKVSTLRITGSTSDEDAKLQVDLLRDRMREILLAKGAGRSLPYLSKVAVLQEAWSKRQDELLKMFSSEA